MALCGKHDDYRKDCERCYVLGDYCLEKGWDYRSQKLPIDKLTSMGIDLFDIIDWSDTQYGRWCVGTIKGPAAPDGVLWFAYLKSTTALYLADTEEKAHKIAAGHHIPTNGWAVYRERDPRATL